MKLGKALGMYAMQPGTTELYYGMEVPKNWLQKLLSGREKAYFRNNERRVK